jgi:hypothetical protein
MNNFFLRILTHKSFYLHRLGGTAYIRYLSFPVTLIYYAKCCKVKYRNFFRSWLMYGSADRLGKKAVVLWVVALWLLPSSGRPDGSCSKNLWNVGKLLPDYTVHHPGRQPSSGGMRFRTCSNVLWNAYTQDLYPKPQGEARLDTYKQRREKNVKIRK